MRLRRSSFAVAIPLAVAAALVACSPEAPNPPVGTFGGSTSGGSSSGGAVTSGGSPTGGTANNSGGAATSGGASSGGAATSGGTPGTGGSSSGGSNTGGSGVPATFETVRTVFREVPCLGAGCHNDHMNPLDLRERDELHAHLTSRISTHCGNIPIVNPGKPNESALIKILKGPCGITPRMPIGCVEDTDSTCVPPAFMAAITQWIANGAPK